MTTVVGMVYATRRTGAIKGNLRSGWFTFPGTVYLRIDHKG
jgi:hypothetical protein